MFIISFTVQSYFLFRFVCIELFLLIWFLQIWVAIYVYGTMINWSILIKKLMRWTYIAIVSGSILSVSTVHLSGVWHLMWHYLLKPVLGGHPVLSGHYSIPGRGCPLNRSFTVGFNFWTTALVFFLPFVNLYIRYWSSWTHLAFNLSYLVGKQQIWQWWIFIDTLFGYSESC